MYHHFIQEMAASLVEAGLVQESQAVENVLSQYWTNKIAIVWTTDEVHSIQKDFDKEKQTSSLSDEQALEILLSVFENHDCSNGITWESLSYHSQELLRKQEEMNDYDEFEAQMLAAGWSFEKIEAAWQKSLREEENISRSSAICHDDYDPSWEEN